MPRSEDWEIDLDHSARDKARRQKTRSAKKRQGLEAKMPLALGKWPVATSDSDSCDEEAASSPVRPVPPVHPGPLQLAAHNTGDSGISAEGTLMASMPLLQRMHLCCCILCGADISALHKRGRNADAHAAVSSWLQKRQGQSGPGPSHLRRAPLADKALGPAHPLTVGAFGALPPTPSLEVRACSGRCLAPQQPGPRTLAPHSALPMTHGTSLSPHRRRRRRCGRLREAFRPRLSRDDGATTGAGCGARRRAALACRGAVRRLLPSVR